MCLHLHDSANLQNLLTLGLKPPFIILPIHKLDLEILLQLVVINIQTRNIDTDKLPDLGFIDRPKGVNPASLAEGLMKRVGLVYVIGNSVTTGEKFEVFGFGSHIPQSLFPAAGAVASTRFGGEIEFDFVFDSAADAASGVLFERHLTFRMWKIGFV
jgi:hypothetical protein